MKAIYYNVTFIIMFLSAFCFVPNRVRKTQLAQNICPLSITASSYWCKCTITNGYLFLFFYEWQLRLIFFFLFVIGHIHHDEIDS